MLSFSSSFHSATSEAAIEAEAGVETRQERRWRAAGPGKKDGEERSTAKHAHFSAIGASTPSVFFSPLLFSETKQCVVQWAWNHITWWYGHEKTLHIRLFINGSDLIVINSFVHQNLYLDFFTFVMIFSWIVLISLRKFLHRKYSQIIHFQWALSPNIKDFRLNIYLTSVKAFV
jgi:hypothetical protein